MIEIKHDPTPREIRVFGLLWLLFFAGVGAVAAWRPEGLVGGAVFLGLAWLASLLFNREARVKQLAGVTMPALFGAVGGAVTSGVALRSVLGLLGAVAVVGALAVWAAPSFGRRLYVAWMTAAAPLGWTISHLVLAAVYFLVLTPIGLALRVLGKDPLSRRFDREARSYWVRRESEVSSERYFRQF